MFIAIDARELCGRPTGVGRYLASLLQEWGRMAPAHDFRLYAPTVPAVPAGPTVSVRIVPGGSGTWWEQVRLPAALAADRPDVLFAPAYTAPLRGAVPVVLTVHDLSFVAHPEWFPWREGVRRRIVTRLAARRAASVITVSDFSQREIVDRFGLPPARVHVIRSGVPELPAGAATPPLRDAGPRVLFVGSIFNRRHVPDLIRAFAPLAAADPQARLDLVGENRTHPREDLDALAAGLGIGPQVAIRSFLPDEELRRLYAGARAFAFLSEYEGFGFTPLEALSAGVPIVVRDTPVAREIYGGAARYVRPGDEAGCTEALRALLYDEATRAQALSAAPAVLARYSWARAAEQTLSLLIEAATPRGGV
ncbi:MAG: glycosyltransferase family 4 protein [Acidobacteriota bacterium]|nr:glycosyltransferase family 4 protein [Acidobacteriota bacterium]